MSELYLVSTLLMGLFVLAVAVAIGRGGQRATPSGNSGGRIGYAEWSNRETQYESRLLEMANSPIAWTISFVVLAVALLGGAVLYVTDGAPAGGVLRTALLAVVGALLLGYVFFGTYFSVRDRSGKSAVAVGVSAVVVGILMLLGIVAALVTG